MRLLTFVLLFWTPMLCAQNADWQPFLDELTDNDRARAVVVGLYEDGETSVLMAGPGDAESIFEIGSVSKVMTALLTQLQVEAGKLDWDQSLGDSFPELEFASDSVAAITLRDLATHTSGLPRLPTNFAFDDPKDPYGGYDRKLLLEFIDNYKPDYLMKEYEYSNLGAGLLGEIAADATGMRYFDAMREQILDPLGMDSSTVGLRDDLSDRLVTGYSDGADMANWSGFDAMAGAGAITSSVNDMLTFIEKNFIDSSLADALAAIRQPQADGETGLGWHIQVVDDDVVHWHNGGTGGYASFLGINIAEQRGVVVLSASTDYTGITDLGFLLISGEAPETSDVDLSPFEGVFELSDGFYFTIYEEANRLYGQATGQGAFPLKQSGEREFRFDAASIVVTFPEGEIEGIEFSQAGNKIDAKRVDDSLGSMPLEEIEVSSDVLDDYVGEYRLAPGAMFTIENRDGQLFAQLTGQQAFPVFPFEADKFFFKVVDAKLYFERDDEGRVVSVTLDQGGLRMAPRVK